MNTLNTHPTDEKKPAAAVVLKIPYWFKLHPEGSWENLRAEANTLQYFVEDWQNKINSGKPNAQEYYVRSLERRVQKLIKEIECLQTRPVVPYDKAWVWFRRTSEGIEHIQPPLSES